MGSSVDNRMNLILKISKLLDGLKYKHGVRLQLLQKSEEWLEEIYNFINEIKTQIDTN